MKAIVPVLLALAITTSSSLRAPPTETSCRQSEHAAPAAGKDAAPGESEIPVEYAGFAEHGIWYQDDCGRDLDRNVRWSALYRDGSLRVHFGGTAKVAGTELDLRLVAGPDDRVKCYAAASWHTDMKTDDNPTSGKLEDIRGTLVIGAGSLRRGDSIRGLFLLTGKEGNERSVMAGGFTASVR
jgi:hypothetical protein